MRGRDDRTRLSYWFPLIEAAGLPVPATHIVRASGSVGTALHGEDGDCLVKLEADIRAAVGVVGVPFFLRTDYTSAKHGWRNTCYVSDLSRLRRHIHDIWEFSECADIFGLPTDVWVVRELLKTRPAFTAFDGMPITTEFRFFVRDGVIEHRQPYWPPDTIHTPDREDWESALAAMNRLSPATDVTLSQLTLKVSAAVPGFWSVDWLLTTDRGWVLTDMADGEKSYRWTPTPATLTPPAQGSALRARGGAR